MGISVWSSRDGTCPRRSFPLAQSRKGCTVSGTPGAHGSCFELVMCKHFMLSLCLRFGCTCGLMPELCCRCSYCTVTCARLMPRTLSSGITTSCWTSNMNMRQRTCKSSSAAHWPTSTTYACRKMPWHGHLQQSQTKSLVAQQHLQMW